MRFSASCISSKGHVGRGAGLAFRTGVVDCWIGIVQDGDGRLVRLAGRLTVAQVPELLQECAESGPLRLDLTDLVSADPAGIGVLQRWQTSCRVDGGRWSRPVASGYATPSLFIRNRN